MNKLSIVVLISGRGSNLSAILKAIESGQLDAHVSAVISDKKDAPGLQYAEAAGIDIVTLKGVNRSEQELNLEQVVDKLQPQLIVLAGFMRILSATFVDIWQGRIINIHPSLLPDLPGLNTHRRALEKGSKLHGVSVHLVTAQVDAGPLIIQAKVPVLETDSEQTLAARVLEQEHIVYPMALQWFAENRISVKENQAYLDNLPLPKVLIT